MFGGLCALDFDQDEDLAAFLAVNPALAATTRSRGSRGGMVWLRVAGEFPASCTTKHFEWRANGRLSTIYGRHPKGNRCNPACKPWRNDNNDSDRQRVAHAQLECGNTQ